MRWSTHARAIFAITLLAIYTGRDPVMVVTPHGIGYGLG